MRMTLNLLAIAAIVFLVAGFGSCSSNSNDDPTPVAVPTALTVGEVTTNSAALSWSGTATSYEVMVGAKTETVTAKTFSATGLVAATEYAWKVRAKAGNEFSDWVDGAKFTTKAESTAVVPPTALIVGELTATTAALSWSGTTTSYEIMVGTKTETVNAKTFNATGLTAATEYAWKVRAQEGANFSEWVDGEKFTTKIEVGPNDIYIEKFDVPGMNVYYGDDYSPGLANNFHVTIYKEGTITTNTGIMLKLDFHVPVTASTTMITEGTYTIAASGVGGNQPMTLDSDYSWFKEIVSGITVLSDTFSSGSAIVSLDGDVYTIKCSFICDATGYKLFGTYVGVLDYKLPGDIRAPELNNSAPFNWERKFRLQK